MSKVAVYGFQVSTFVNIVGLVLVEKGVPFAFHDLASEMGTARHLALHPFNRVPILEHDGFRLYETAAIALYVDEAFDGPPLRPADAKAR
jgi:glutathione S-transferase